MEHEIMYKNWCTVNLDNLVHNYLYTKKQFDNKVICVIKADAYGHGAVEVATALKEAGCDYFAVSSFEEAKQLRDANINQNILVLGRVMPNEIKEAASLDISLAASSVGFIQDILNADIKHDKVKIHIKLNTGMNRTGFNALSSGYDELTQALKLIGDNKSLIEVEGIFSHFASAEDDESFTRLQYDRFTDAVNYINSFGISASICHICNSAGALNYKDFSLDAVRLGIYLYGYETDDPNYLPVMSFHSRILEINELKTGDGVSYGLDFVADREMKIAVVGVGYADGVPRSLSNSKGYVMCNGVKCPIIGRVCMDMMMIDITGVENAKVFDTVTLFGNGSGGYISCTEQAANAGTIAYELLCSVSKRVPRIYI